MTLALHLTSDNGNLRPSEYPSNSRRGRICIYYKSALSLNVPNIHYLQESINLELKIGNKLCNFISWYRPPSQKQDEFERFSGNLERNLYRLFQSKPFLVIGDFNVKSSN